MPRPLPPQTREKETPTNATPAKQVPDAEVLTRSIPEETDEIHYVPENKPLVEEVPEESKLVEETPEAKAIDKETPPTYDEDNTIFVNGEPIEIKPTKLKYFRNKTATAYALLKQVPISEFLIYEKGQIEKDRSADQILFDFLIAVFDDVEFVVKNYDEISAADVDKILKIFGRINHIDEREEAARKNREAQAKR